MSVQEIKETLEMAKKLVREVKNQVVDFDSTLIGDLANVNIILSKTIDRI